MHFYYFIATILTLFNDHINCALTLIQQWCTPIIFPASSGICLKSDSPLLLFHFPPSTYLNTSVIPRGESIGGGDGGDRPLPHRVEIIFLIVVFMHKLNHYSLYLVQNQ